MLEPGERKVGSGGEVMGKTKGGKKREKGKWDPPCVRKWREIIVGLFRWFCQ